MTSCPGCPGWTWWSRGTPPAGTGPCERARGRSWWCRGTGPGPSPFSTLTRTGETGLTEDGFRMWFLQTLKAGDGGLEAMVHDFQVAHGLIK